MRILTEGKAEYLAVDPDGFRAHVRDHKQRSLTPKLMSASEAVGKYVADGDYLVQERVPTARETFPAVTDDGRIEFAEQLVDLDPLLFNGKVGSAFTRLSFTELANVSSGGGMVPTYIISQKT